MQNPKNQFDEVVMECMQILVIACVSTLHDICDSIGGIVSLFKIVNINAIVIYNTC